MPGASDLPTGSVIDTIQRIQTGQSWPFRQKLQCDSAIHLGLSPLGSPGSYYAPI